MEAHGRNQAGLGFTGEVRMKKVYGSVVLSGCLVAVASFSAFAQPDKVVVGINMVNPGRFKVEQQNAMLSEMKKAGVRVIRCGVSPDDKGLDFAKRVYAQGIKIELGVSVQFRDGAPTRQSQPKEFPGMWSGHPLSYADPDKFRAYFEPLLAKLEEQGIVLAAFELGNEINWTAFNAEFPLPGEGKGVLSLDDLYHDTEGKQIAKGYLQYLKVLAVLKDIRDHSKLNQHTPVITAGLIDAEQGDIKAGSKVDAASFSATLDFMRANGLDKIVDGYGIHIYPNGNPKAPANQRMHAIDQETFDKECRPPGSAAGKPCWITEWGIANRDTSCPGHEENRTMVMRQMLGIFYEYAKEKRIEGLILFTWNSDAWAKQVDKFAMYRCGALTEGGRLAIMPLSRAEDAKDTEPNKASRTENLRIRVGVPFVARGPAPNIADNYFTEIKLPNGKFRGFTAAGTTFAIDGNQPWDMGGPAVTVLRPGPKNSPSSCGQWIQHVEPAGTKLVGWVHNETDCDYKNNGQTHTSMTIATSADNGITWKIQGFIIKGKTSDKPTPGVMTGESCINALNGGDGYYYAYCGRSRDHVSYVARASVSNPGPGKWEKYFNGAWSQPGLGGDASNLGEGGAAASWLTTGETVKVIWVRDGLGLAFSQDRLHFTNFPEPLMKLDNGRWDRGGPPNELLSYGDLIGVDTGRNQLSDHWLMAYMYLQPKEGFDKRYLVFRKIEVSRSRKPDELQVGVMLAHWYNAKLHDHWSTVAPVPGNYKDYKLEAQSRYLMTAADAKHPTVELEDCVSQRAGHPDHILIQKGVCETQGYERLRSAGFVYSTEQPGTQPLYRCYSVSEKSHFAATDEDCHRMGKREALLGYDLKE